MPCEHCGAACPMFHTTVIADRLHNFCSAPCAKAVFPDVVTIEERDLGGEWVSLWPDMQGVYVPVVDR